MMAPDSQARDSYCHCSLPQWKLIGVPEFLIYSSASLFLKIDPLNLSCQYNFGWVKYV